MTTCARFGRSVTRPSDARNVSTAASWCINRRADGGLELPGKVVQERLGHSSIMMTMDVYGPAWRRFGRT
jgi:integrase